MEKLRCLWYQVDKYVSGPEGSPLMCEYTGWVNEDKQVCTGACMCVKA